MSLKVVLNENTKQIEIFHTKFKKSFPISNKITIEDFYFLKNGELKNPKGINFNKIKSFNNYFKTIQFELPSGILTITTIGSSYEKNGEKIFTYGSDLF